MATHFYRMERVKRFKTGTFDKGVEIKQGETDKEARDLAYQSYHAYLGAYAYGKDKDVDYVSVCVINRAGLQLTSETWDVIEDEEPEIEGEV